MSGLLILFGAALGILVALLAAMLAWEMTHPPRHTAAYAIVRNIACSPDELGLVFETWHLDRPDRARLPVWDIRGRRHVSGNHDSVSPGTSELTGVFVHGWGHSRIDVLSRIKPFLQGCDRLILYDLRGHGDSEGCSSRLGDGESEDLIELLQRLGEDRFILIGHSMGAVLAMHAVIGADRQLRERIAGVMVYGPYCEFHRSLIGRLKSAGYPTRPMTDLALLFLRVLGVRPLSVKEADLLGWPVPLRVLHGDRDGISPLDHSRRIVEAAGPEARLHVFSGAAHTDIHSINEQQHEEIVRGFLDSLRAGR